MALTPQTILLHRTTTNSAPPGALPAGSLAVGIPPTQTRVWLGDGTVNRLVASSDPLDTPIALSTVAHNASMAGTGQAASQLTLVPATIGEGFTGVDNVKAMTSARVRDQIGDSVFNLTTAAKTIVPAINELDEIVRLLANTLVLAGGYDVATDDVHPVTGIGAVAGPLPPPSNANRGWYVIVQVPGTGSGNAPAVAMNTGDWLISDGVEWLYFSMGIGDITAEGVAVTLIPNLNATNVQAALEWLQTYKLDLNDGDGRYLQLTGGELSGALTLPGPPSTAMQATTKGYVDDLAGNYVPLGGAVMTGLLLLSGDPDTGLGAATKNYVDNAIGSGISSVVTDNYSILGNGTIGAPLHVNIVDGGEY